MREENKVGEAHEDGSRISQKESLARNEQDSRREAIEPEHENLNLEERTFVKPAGVKLVVIIDENSRLENDFTTMTSQFDLFRAQVKCFTTGAEAMSFLKSVREPDRPTRAPADLVLMTYDIKVSRGLTQLEEIIAYYELECDPALEAKVIVCSTIEL